MKLSTDERERIEQMADNYCSKCVNSIVCLETTPRSECNDRLLMKAIAQTYTDEHLDERIEEYKSEREARTQSRNKYEKALNNILKTYPYDRNIVLLKELIELSIKKRPVESITLESVGDEMIETKSVSCPTCGADRWSLYFGSCGRCGQKIDMEKRITKKDVQDYKRLKKGMEDGVLQD